jgi:hypothetical protein
MTSPFAAEPWYSPAATASHRCNLVQFAFAFVAVIATIVVGGWAGAVAAALLLLSSRCILQKRGKTAKSYFICGALINIIVMVIVLIAGILLVIASQTLSRFYADNCDPDYPDVECAEYKYLAHVAIIAAVIYGAVMLLACSVCLFNCRAAKNPGEPPEAQASITSADVVQMSGQAVPTESVVNSPESV